MLASPESVAAVLGMPAGTTGEVEPLGLRPGSPEHVLLSPPGGPRMDVMVRRSPDPDRAANHLAVMETFTRLGFAQAPRLLAIVGDTTVEEYLAGLSPMSVVPSDSELRAAVEALAAVHSLASREGLRWELRPAETLPGPDLPVFRLGYSAAERDAARPAMDQVHAALAESPIGFAHGSAVADHVVCARGRAWLVNFEDAGQGAQLLDVAAFLLTAGLDAPERRLLASHYARQRGLAEEETAELIDAGGLLWGLNWLLAVPRRLVENYGDDIASARIRLEAARIDEGMRSPAGTHPAAAAIRAALFDG